METINAENSLRMIREAQRAVATEFELDAATNTFRKPLPEWVVELNEKLHAAHDHAVNAIDPKCDRPHGWWESL